jgi:hypothetical protein
MLVSLEIPDELAAILQVLASRRHSSLQEEALRALENVFFKQQAPQPTDARVQLPLIHSSAPGTFRSLTNAEIDEILGRY